MKKDSYVEVYLDDDTMEKLCSCIMFAGEDMHQEWRRMEGQIEPEENAFWFYCKYNKALTVQACVEVEKGKVRTFKSMAVSLEDRYYTPFTIKIPSECKNKICDGIDCALKAETDIISKPIEDFYKKVVPQS